MLSIPPAPLLTPFRSPQRSSHGSDCLQLPDRRWLYRAKYLTPVSPAAFSHAHPSSLPTEKAPALLANSPGGSSQYRRLFAAHVFLPASPASRNPTHPRYPHKPEASPFGARYPQNNNTCYGLAAQSARTQTGRENEYPRLSCSMK